MKAKKYFISAFVSVMLLFLLIGPTVSLNAETVEEPIVMKPDIMDRVPELVISLIGVLTSGGVLAAVMSFKRKQVIEVKDSQTQNELSDLKSEIKDLKYIISAMVTLEKGTLDAQKAIFLENPSIDKKIKLSVEAISKNSEDIIKDLQEIIGDNPRNALKQVGTKIKKTVDTLF